MGSTLRPADTVLTSGRALHVFPGTTNATGDAVWAARCGTQGPVHATGAVGRLRGACPAGLRAGRPNETPTHTRPGKTGSGTWHGAACAAHARGRACRTGSGRRGALLPSAFRTHHGPDSGTDVARARTPLRENAEDHELSRGIRTRQNREHERSGGMRKQRLSAEWGRAETWEAVLLVCLFVFSKFFPSVKEWMVPAIPPDADHADEAGGIRVVTFASF